MAVARTPLTLFTARPAARASILLVLYVWCVIWPLERCMTPIIATVGPDVKGHGMCFNHKGLHGRAAWSVVPLQGQQAYLGTAMLKCMARRNRQQAAAAGWVRTAVRINARAQNRPFASGQTLLPLDYNAPIWFATTTTSTLLPFR